MNSVPERKWDGGRIVSANQSYLFFPEAPNNAAAGRKVRLAGPARRALGQQAGAVARPANAANGDGLQAELVRRALALAGVR